MPIIETKAPRVLIVEDEALVSEMIRGQLEAAGYPVAGICADGLQALALVHTLRPDVLVLDLNLPKLDGLAVARQLLAERPTPVVILTAYETPALVEEASAAGVGAYLTKPPDARALDRAIQITLARFEDLRTARRLNAALEAEVTQRRQAEEEVRRLNSGLEERVAARTAELQQSNAALTKALRAKDEFLATMSHELRTPLTAVLGLSEALQMQVYGPLTEKQLKSLKTIQASGQHLLSLISDVLDFAGVAADQLTLGPVSVVAFCHACLQQVKPAAAKKKLRVSFAQDSTVEFVRADERRLQQVIGRLFDNAVKFTPEGGTIGLEVTGDAGQQAVHFTVWDTGVGIAPEDQARIFEPFVQLDARLARNYEGAGLGLALAKRLVELQGGRISVTSSGISSEGSRFSLTFPWQPSSD